MANPYSLNRAARLMRASENPIWRDTTRAAARRAAERIIARHVAAGKSERLVRKIVANLGAIQDKHN